MAPSIKLFLQIPSLVLAIIGFLLIFIALGTPAWQVVYAREIQQWIQSGLWLSCQTRPAGSYQCTYQFSKSDYDFYTSAEVVSFRTPAFYPWQRTLLHILLIGQLCCLIAFFSFCASNSSKIEKTAAIVFSALIAAATVIGFGCMLAFAAYAHMVEYRFYHVSVSGIYEKHTGYSYYLAITGCCFYLLSLIISIVYLYKLFTRDRWASGGSHSTIHAYTQSPNFGRRSQFSSFMDDEHRFAMRALPELPPKYRR